MTNLPTDPETLSTNAEYVLLQTGSNPDTYTVLQDLNMHLGRPVISEVATGSTASPALLRIKFMGAADNWIEATMLLSLTEFISFAVTNLARDANGNLPLIYTKIKFTDKAGTTKTMGNTANTPTGFKAKLASCDLQKPVMGAAKYRIRLELLEDSVTIT